MQCCPFVTHGNRELNHTHPISVGKKTAMSKQIKFTRLRGVGHSIILEILTEFSGRFQVFGIVHGNQDIQQSLQRLRVSLVSGHVTPCSVVIG